MTASAREAITQLIGRLQAFEACAWFDREMDQLIYLQEDVSYTADRFDPLLTILWHPDDHDRVVGLKFKGFRELYAWLEERKLVKPDGFLDLIQVLTLTLAKGVGAVAVEKHEKANGEKRLEKIQRATAFARQAGQHGYVRFQQAA